MNSTKRKIYHCLRCDYDWLSSVAGGPMRCARCKRPDWNKKNLVERGIKTAVPWYAREVKT